MSNLKIELAANGKLTVFELRQPRIHHLNTNPNHYGGLLQRRLLIRDQLYVVCLSLDDAVEQCESKRLISSFLRKEPEVVRLIPPIMAIHLIRPGRGWPDDEGDDGLEIIHRVPDERWVFQCAPPPVGQESPLLYQPPGSFLIQSPFAGREQLSLRYEDLVRVEQSGERVLITFDAKARTSLLGSAITTLADAKMADALAAGLRLRRVRRLRHNPIVPRIQLFPHAFACRGDNHSVVESVKFAEFHSEKLRTDLVQIAKRSLPAEITNALQLQWKPQPIQNGRT